MTNWKEYKLGEICSKIGSGATPRGGGDTYLDSGKYALIRSQNVLDFAFSYNGLAYISEEQANKLKNVALEENDILLNITGDSVARVCEVPANLIPARVNQHVAIIRPDQKILQYDFLKYYLLNPVFKEYLLMLSSSGATRNAITKGMIENLTISVPDLPTQTAIAEILSSLDDKIELNNKINQELENLAQTLFKQWFIDFEFPNQNGDPYKSSGGEMVDSELGEVPKGWEVKTLGELIKLTGGGTPKRSNLEYWDGNIKWFSIQDVPQSSQVFVIDTKETISQMGLAKSSTKLLAKGSTIITARGTVGKLALVAEPMAMNQSCYAVNGACDLGDFFTYFNLKNAVEQLRQNTHGAVFDTITSNTFDTIKSVFSSLALANLFEELISPTMHLIESNCRENQELTNLRNTLLPKLISGELEVNNHNF
jgi:type I restriction enzyme S subunit